MDSFRLKKLRVDIYLLPPIQVLLLLVNAFISIFLVIYSSFLITITVTNHPHLISLVSKARYLLLVFDCTHNFFSFLLNGFLSYSFLIQEIFFFSPSMEKERKKLLLSYLSTPNTSSPLFIQNTSSSTFLLLLLSFLIYSSVVLRVLLEQFTILTLPA